MYYLEAPNRKLPQDVAKLRSIFLGGGITGCPDWQTWFLHTQVFETSGVFFNPRRADFPIGDPNAALAQVRWEFDHLRKATAVLFWFPKETLCPIVLYELGAWSMTEKPLFVGVDPDYQRKQDVEIQTRLVRPDVSVVYDLGTLGQMVRDWLAATPWRE